MMSNIQQAIFAAQQQMRQNGNAPREDQNQMMKVLQSGDEQAGIQMANQILGKLGISREEAMRQVSAGLPKYGIRME